MNTMRFTVADMGIEVLSNYPLSASSWDAFAAKDSASADFTYHCLLSSELPPLAETPSVRRYFDDVKNRVYAITQERETSMTIHLSQENLPWGTELMQLYEQLALPHALLLHSKLLIHASYILTDRGAVAFTAPSGTGKSTQAELWRQHRDALIVNGDRCVVGLRENAAFAYGYPASGSSTDCRNITAPLRAIVALKQAKSNAVRSFSGAQAVRVLVNGCYLPKEYRADLPAVMQTAIELAGSVPILELSCLPDESAVCVLEDYLRRMENGTGAARLGQSSKGER